MMPLQTIAGTPGRGAVALALGALVWCWALSWAWGYDIRIGTRTALSASVHAEGTRVTVDGHLRDNVGQGIEGETVQVEFEQGGESGQFYAREARTDRTGRFYMALTLDPGQYRVTTTYAGREHYYARHSVEDTVSSQQGRVELSLQVPRLLPRDAGTVPVRLAVTNGANPVPELPLSVEVGGEAVEVVTGPEGTASVPLSLASVRGARVLVRAAFEGTKAYAAASASTTVRLLDGPALTLEAQNVRARLDRGVRVRGEVTDQHGEVEGALVDVSLRQKGAEVGRYSTRTDDDGQYDLFVPEDRLSEGPLEVQAWLMAQGASLAEGSASLEVSRTGGGLIPWLLGGALLLSVGVLGSVALRDAWRAWQRRKPKKSDRSRRSLSGAREPGIRAMPQGDDGEAAPGPVDLAGALWDDQVEAPIEGGLVRVLTLGSGAGGDPEALPEAARATSNAQGRFRVEGLAPGRYMLHARARGYISASYRFEIPHSGVLSRFRFPLTPVRVVVRDLYEELVDEVVRERGSWGRLTPRQVRGRLLALVEASIQPGAFPGGAEGYQAFRARLEEALEARRQGQDLDGAAAVEALVSVLEEVYYSQRLHDEALATVMERLTEVIRGTARQPGRGR